MLTDIEISKKAKLLNITEVAKKLGIEDIEQYGKYKAKISNEVIKSVEKNKDGKLILVTAINPTPAGEGKTTVTISLGEAMEKINKKAIIALREPSLGPVFGVKGGATGGGYAQVCPMEEINLHFTGDFHAITAANNLLCACIDNHLYQGNELNIDKDRILISRAVDMNDRVLRDITVGQGKVTNGIERKDSYKITVASEVMAVFCLSENIFDLKEKLGNILVAYSLDNKPIYIKDLKVQGAMTALLKDAIKPNLIQTLENTPCLMHGGPFANIAHGCNSIIATKLGLKLADYCITEAGFGADLGAEKFLDITCEKGKFTPNVIVLVATIRALKYNGGVTKENLNVENLDALKKGICNLERHISNLKKYKVPLVVTLNKFANDTDKEVEFVKEFCEKNEVEFEICEGFAKGSEGATALAEKVVKLCDEETNYTKIYDNNMSIKEKIDVLAREIYGAKDVAYTDKAEKKITEIHNLNMDKLPICVAKTQSSFSDDKTKLGAPKDYTLNISDVTLSSGAGFIVVYCGNILTMPGLPKNPTYEKIDIDENGEILGIF